MAALVWDELTDRLFETGVDRGVLFDENYKAHAWNGLTGVSRNYSDFKSEEYFHEGFKTYDRPGIGDFEATLTAFTYPDKFLEFEGTSEVEDGLYVGEQEPKTFGLSWRTRVGDYISGPDAHYKIHVLYNLMATPTTRSYDTVSDSHTPVQFEWSLTSVPPDAPGYWPTTHLIFDSRRIDPGLLSILENVFYGNAGSDGRQMRLWEVIQYTKDNWS